MKNLKNKTRLFAIIFVLMLTFAAISVALPIVSAHDPPWTIQNWAYVSATPDVIGVNQEVLIVFWSAQYPHTAQGAYGDRYTWNVEITKPNGDKENFGPYTSDPVGSGWLSYTPTEQGTYSVVAIVDTHVYTGLPDTTPSTIRGPDYVGDTVVGDASDPVEFTVQQDPIEGYEDAPLPERYWTRPLHGANRNWWKVAGNWLGGSHLPGNINPYSTGPRART